MLSPEALVAALRQFLPGIVVREVLAAREGIKVARTGLKGAQAQRLKVLGEANGFHVVIGTQEVFPRRDRGKGGWCNGSLEGGRPGHGYLNVYVAANASLAQAAYDAETAGDDLAFGAILGTPACCRQFYEKVKEQAAQDQNDFFPFSAPLDPTFRPHALLNLGAQYFDASLISHFPCSLVCADSLALARTNARIMKAYDQKWLEGMLDLLNHGVLYTEYIGIYLFSSPFLAADGSMHYAQPLKGTANGPLFQALAQGDTLRLRRGRVLDIHHGMRLVSSHRARNLRLFAPEPSTMEEATS
jgi:hypothetical protein